MYVSECRGDAARTYPCFLLAARGDMSWWIRLPFCCWRCFLLLPAAASCCWLRPGLHLLRGGSLVSLECRQRRMRKLDTPGGQSLHTASYHSKTRQSGKLTLLELASSTSGLMGNRRVKDMCVGLFSETAAVPLWKHELCVSKRLG